jgi:hypothetical protein
MNTSQAAALLGSIVLTGASIVLTPSGAAQGDVEARQGPARQLAAPSVAGGHSALSGGRSLRAMLSASDLVFTGEVVDIEYANSQPDAMHPTGLPHTFVTYRVEGVVRGAGDSHVTLRFIGGFDPARDQILQVGDVPVFRVGDRDVLFVRANGASINPIVDPKLGRLRVVDGRVLTQRGRPVQVDAGESLRVGVGRFESRAEIEGAGFERDLPVGTEVDVSGAITSGDLMEVLRSIAVEDTSSGLFRSADPRAKFEGLKLMPRPAPSNASEGGSAKSDTHDLILQPHRHSNEGAIRRS